MLKTSSGGVFRAMMSSLLLVWGLLGAHATNATNAPSTLELQPLQGAWTGVIVGQESAGKINITITGNSLRFQGVDKSDWYEATFTLPAETSPPQLRATITGCLQTNYIGVVVRAIFKIEGATLTLAGIQDRDQEPPKSFTEAQSSLKLSDGILGFPESSSGSLGETKAFEDNTVFRYKLGKVEPQKKTTEATRVEQGK